MNTDIMKERIKVKNPLINNFGQELSLYDVVIVNQYGAMRPAIITKINDNKSIKLDICQKKFYPREMLLANGIISNEEIKKYVQKFMNNKAAKEAAKNEKIYYKYIFGYWKNIKTKRFGILLIKIPSLPGKQVSKKNISSAFEKWQEFLNKHKQYKIQFLADKSFYMSHSLYMSPDIWKSKVFTATSLEENFSFTIDEVIYQKNYCENPLTGESEFDNLSEKDSIFLILEKKSKIIKEFNNSYHLNFTSDNLDENYLFYKIENNNKSYGFVRRLYLQEKEIKNFINNNK